MDVSSCMYNFYGYKLDWICGGQLSELEARLRKFCQHMNDIGVKIVAFFDGGLPEVKFEGWKKRRYDNAESLKKQLDSVQQGKFEPNSNFQIPPVSNLIARAVFSEFKNCVVSWYFIDMQFSVPPPAQPVIL